jgi:hypothetical protein
MEMASEFSQPVKAKYRQRQSLKNISPSCRNG